ncbi:MAG: NUDIX hydrolase [Bacteroidota bacterium]
MYKIYINDHPLQLISTSDKAHFPANDDKNLLARYPGKSKMLLNYIDMLEKSSRFESVTLYADDVEKLFADFSGHFKIIRAAGGVVFNPEGKILFIFRRGFWDLPKGKIDKSETIEAAAIREVQEETGIEALTLGNALPTTYHTYRHPTKKVRVLKQTFWFEMQTDEQQLIPQAEEDIEKAVWLSLEDFADTGGPIYSNISMLLQHI